MNWRWISLSALLAALVIGYGALSGRGTRPLRSQAPPEQPGYYLEDAVITQTQQDGSLELKLEAERIEQQRNDDSIALHGVRAEYFESPERQWQLSAQRGLVPANSRILHLAGNVELRPADSATTFLRTDALAIDPEKNIAYSTSSPVSLRFGQHTMTVNSFRADLSNETIRLESVDGRFEPEQ
ncbi:MAG TPA: LPS export ABC transporter periplasmic protein LptC [Steroidobacter sp.]